MKLKSKIIIIIAILCLGYIIMTPSEEKVLKQLDLIDNKSNSSELLDFFIFIKDKFKYFNRTYKIVFRNHKVIELILN